MRSLSADTCERFHQLLLEEAAALEKELGMIFIANQNGSHNPHEEMIMKDFMTGTDLLWQTVRQFD